MLRRLMTTTSEQSTSVGILEQLRAMIPRARKNSSGTSYTTPPLENAVEGCLFCLRHSAAQNEIMLQNEAFFARYDNYPAKPGHIEIVPKRHVESFFELSSEEVTKAYALICQARDELNEQYDPDGYTIGINEGDASGRSVKHLHIHLIPRHNGDVKDPRGGIRQIVPNWNPDLWQGRSGHQEVRA